MNGGKIWIWPRSAKCSVGKRLAHRLTVLQSWIFHECLWVLIVFIFFNLYFFVCLFCFVCLMTILPQCANGCACEIILIQGAQSSTNFRIRSSLLESLGISLCIHLSRLRSSLHGWWNVLGHLLWHILPTCQGKGPISAIECVWKLLWNAAWNAAWNVMNGVGPVGNQFACLPQACTTFTSHHLYASKPFLKTGLSLFNIAATQLATPESDYLAAWLRESGFSHCITMHHYASLCIIMHHCYDCYESPGWSRCVEVVPSVPKSRSPPVGLHLSCRRRQEEGFRGASGIPADSWNKQNGQNGQNGQIQQQISKESAETSLSQKVNNVG